jgi:hypothetical protein
VQIERNTYQAGQSTQASTVSAADHATKLALDKKFGGSHSCAIDRFLLPFTATTSRLVKEPGNLGHSHADQL